MFTDALALALQPFIWAFGVVSDILYNAGALPVFFAMFAASVVVRMFIRPIVGEAKTGKDINKNT